MYDIYKYNDDFELHNVIDRVNCIADELAQEQTKSIEERDYKKERDLMYAQFIQGLKLSTGENKLF